jgi:hypothetical protein
MSNSNIKKVFEAKRRYDNGEITKDEYMDILVKYYDVYASTDGSIEDDGEFLDCLTDDELYDVMYSLIYDVVDFSISFSLEEFEDKGDYDSILDELSDSFSWYVYIEDGSDHYKKFREYVESRIGKLPFKEIVDEVLDEYYSYYEEVVEDEEY